MMDLLVFPWNSTREWNWKYRMRTTLLVVAQHMVHRMCLPSKGLRLIMVLGLCEMLVHMSTHDHDGTWSCMMARGLKYKGMFGRL